MLKDSTARKMQKKELGHWFKLLFIGFIVFAIVGALIVYVKGDSEDPAGYCSREQYPYIELCDEQQINKMYQELLERTKEWNNNKTCDFSKQSCEHIIAPQIQNYNK